MKIEEGSGLQLVFCNVFEIKFVEMSEPAVPAPHGKMPAAYGQIVRTGDMAVPAFCGLDKFPEIITANLREGSLFHDILDPGYKNPGSTTVVTGNLCFVRHGFYDLVSIFFTMVAVGAVPREDETFAHKR